MKVMIVVTHLLGTGHLSRALTLAKGFVQADHEAVVVSGGVPVPQLDPGDAALLQLPALRSDGVNFAQLLTAAGNPVDDPMLHGRLDALLSVLDDQAPDVLLTELFPFGRRVLRAEFIALLEAAKAQDKPPLILSSIRDILAPPSKPKKAAFADEVVERFYDGVLVHADPMITPLDLSWPVTEALAERLRYTGFVAPPVADTPTKAGEGEVIVSAGGGDVGRGVFTAALEAAAGDRARPWRLLLGGADAAERCAALATEAADNVTIEPARPDFRAMLHNVAASVSLCGYNTALDVLQAGCPAVFVPFDAGSEVEQGIRARALTQQNGIAAIRSAELTPEGLLHAVQEVIAAPARAPMKAGLDGARETVRIVEHMFEARR
jgi:predicted glycosyltransferase